MDRSSFWFWCVLRIHKAIVKGTKISIVIHRFEDMICVVLVLCLTWCHSWSRFPISMECLRILKEKKKQYEWILSLSHSLCYVYGVWCVLFIHFILCLCMVLAQFFHGNNVFQRFSHIYTNTYTISI